jgi:hypothetical protein
MGSETDSMIITARLRSKKVKIDVMVHEDPTWPLTLVFGEGTIHMGKKHAQEIADKINLAIIELDSTEKK